MSPVATLYGSEIRVERCRHCGQEVWLSSCTTGGARFDPTPSVDGDSQYCWRLREETVRAEIQGAPALAVTTFDLLDQPTAIKLKAEGVALHRQHGPGCDQRPAPEPGPKMPWTTAA